MDCAVCRLSLSGRSAGPVRLCSSSDSSRRTSSSSNWHSLVLVGCSAQRLCTAEALCSLCLSAVARCVLVCSRVRVDERQAQRLSVEEDLLLEDVASLARLLDLVDQLPELESARLAVSAAAGLSAGLNAGLRAQVRPSVQQQSGFQADAHQLPEEVQVVQVDGGRLGRPRQSRRDGGDGPDVHVGLVQVALQHVGREAWNGGVLGGRLQLRHDRRGNSLSGPVAHAVHIVFE